MAEPFGDNLGHSDGRGAGSNRDYLDSATLITACACAPGSLGATCGHRLNTRSNGRKSGLFRHGQPTAHLVCYA